MAIIHGCTDVAIVDGGLGGVSAALAALRLGKRVALAEELEWLGGQLTAQAVPPVRCSIIGPRRIAAVRGFHSLRRLPIRP